MTELEEAEREIARMRTGFEQIRMTAGMSDTSRPDAMHDDLRFCHDVANAMLTTSKPFQPST